MAHFSPAFHELFITRAVVFDTTKIKLQIDA